jgi:hypothetical protein
MMEEEEEEEVAKSEERLQLHMTLDHQLSVIQRSWRTSYDHLWHHLKV